jgi:hypothetical protein
VVSTNYALFQTRTGAALLPVRVCPVAYTDVLFKQVLTIVLCFFACVVLQVPPDMPSEYSLLMRSCWDGDSAKRPTFAQVIQCLELLLDNLTSDSDGRISEGSEGAQSTSSNSGKGGNASGGNASSVTLEELLARKSEPAGAAAEGAGALPAETACGGKDDSGAASSSTAAAAAADIAAGRPGGMISSSRLPVASGSGLGAGTPGASQRSDQQQQELQLVALPDKALSDRVPSGPSVASSRAVIGTSSLLGTGSRAGQTGGTWSSSLGGSGSLGSALGVPATPQQPAVPQQQGAWQQIGRFGLRRQQQAEPGSGSKDTTDGSQLVQDL